jgi:DNA-binding NarL/FixJ family response regulator
MSTPKVKVLIVDDHRLLRDCLAALLVQAPDIEVVGLVVDAEEAINICPTMKPDVVLMDIMMHGMTGIEATRWLKEQHSDVKVILVSSEITKELVVAGIQCGIDGYLPKNVDLNVLCDAIRIVRNGGRYFDQSVTNLVFDEFYDRKKKLNSSSDRIRLPNQLTKREQEILVLIASGRSNRQVADQLFISVKTVETHRSHILVKLDLKNTAELVKYAVMNKLITLE